MSYYFDGADTNGFASGGFTSIRCDIKNYGVSQSKLKSWMSTGLIATTATKRFLFGLQRLMLLTMRESFLMMARQQRPCLYLEILSIFFRRQLWLLPNETFTEYKNSLWYYIHGNFVFRLSLHFIFVRNLYYYYRNLSSNTDSNDDGKSEQDLALIDIQREIK